MQALPTLLTWGQMTQKMTELKSIKNQADIEKLELLWKEYTGRIGTACKHTKKSITNLNTAVSARKSDKMKAADAAATTRLQTEQDLLKALDKARQDRLRNILTPTGYVLLLSVMLRVTIRAL